MDYNHISKLLERYFEGETTLQEEKQLRRYFVEEQVAAEHEPYRDMFRFFTAEQKAGFQGEIRQLDGIGQEKSYRKRRFRIHPVFWRAAAVVAIGMSAWWLYPEQEASTTTIDWTKYEPATPEEAFRIASGALMSASVKLNSGARQAAQKVSEVQKVF